jgi:hypothetical protein
MRQSSVTGHSRYCSSLKSIPKSLYKIQFDYSCLQIWKPVIFLTPFRQILGYHLPVGHICYHPYPFQFITLRRTPFQRRVTYALEETSLIKITIFCLRNHRKQWLSGKHSCFVFGRLQFRFQARQR